MSSLRRSKLGTKSIAFVLWSLLLLGGFAPSSAQPEPSLYEHSFYDCRAAGLDKFRQQVAGNPACRVFYSVFEDRVAVVLDDPQKALKIPEEAEQPEMAAKIRDLCLDTQQRTPLLKEDLLPSENPEIAILELARGDLSEAQILCLASQLRTIAGVEEAGAVARVASRPGPMIFLDSIRIGVQELPDGLMLSDSDVLDSLQKVGLRLMALDPFDSEHGVLLKAVYSPHAQLDNSLLGIDLMACVVTMGGQVVDVASCLDGISLINKKDAGKALKIFAKAEPWLVRPTLLPISVKGDEAEFTAWRKGEIKKEASLSSKITFNSVSNTTDTDDEALLSADASISQGTYPGQLRFDVGAQVEFDDEDFEENVTNIRVNYDHYFRPWLEVYGFVERFSNTFLGIEQRWEGGGGILFEYDWRTRNANGVTSRDRFCASRGLGNRGYTGKSALLTREARFRMAQYREEIRRELLQRGVISDATAESYCRYQPGIVKRNAKLQLGLALSVFSDFEQPDQLRLKATPVDDMGRPIEDSDAVKTAELSPDSSQMMRISIRPTLTWRPADRLTLDFWYYYKLSDNDAPDGSNDYRTELAARVNFLLNAKDPKVILTGSFTRFFNSVPPAVSFTQAMGALDLMLPEDMETVSMQAIDANGAPFEVTGLVADDDHEVVKFGVTLSF